MRLNLIAFCLFVAFFLCPSAITRAQNEQSQEKPAASEEAQDGETIKIDTNLVVVPVVANNRNGVYIPDLQKDEFTLFEDGAKQEVVFFAPTTAPFHVVLMLDTSASTQEKLFDIQRAAISFITQLQSDDRVKIISFDDEIRDHNHFTSDQAELRRAIESIRPGKGTKLYDAVQQAFDALRPVKGRKAIVLFTDGVDFHSSEWRYIDNMRELEESGVIIYPIRFETRAETEQLARRQAQGGGSVDLGSILGGGDNGNNGTTATTFPGGSVPIPGGGGGTIGGMQIPSIIINRPRDDRRDDRRNDPRETRRSDDPFPDASYPGRRRSDDPNWPTDTSGGRGRGSSDDSISRMLDLLYKTADGYLNDLAVKSGGRLTRADTLVSLPAAFKEIAAELRTQYALGYYPASSAGNGRYHKLRVTTTRKNVAVRARPGYQSKRKN